MVKSKVIQTGVDKLVDLVKSEGIISSKDAANRLGVSLATINEWSSFLEEEGVITIKYKFTVPYLSKRAISDQERDKIERRLKDEKSIFKRKSESTLNYLYTLEKEVVVLKQLLSDLGGKFHFRFKNVRKDLEDLKKVEDEKMKVDQEIVSAKNNFVQKLDLVNSRLSKKKGSVEQFYDHIANEADISKEFLDLERKELELVEKNQKFLDERLSQINVLLSKKVSLLSSKSKSDLTQERLRLQQLEATYIKLKKELANEHKLMLDLFSEARIKQEKLKASQEMLMRTIKEKSIMLERELSDMKDLPDKFKSYLEKKSVISEILNKITYNEQLLKGKLMELMRKEQIMDVSQSSKFIHDMEALNRDLNKIQDKRKFFDEEIKKLVKLIRR